MCSMGLEKEAASYPMSYSSVCIYWKWPKPFDKIQPYVVIASCFLVNLTVGSLYAIGNMIPYIISYVRTYSHPHSLRLNTATYIYASQAVGVGMAMLLSGLLDKYIGPRLVVLIGGVFMTTGAILSYVTIQFSFWWFVFSYGLITGVGLGILYISPITCSMKWLPKWKGLVSGFTLSGIALGTLVYSLVQTGYINPHNKKPEFAPYPKSPHEKYFTDHDVLEKVPDIFIYMGVSYAIITILGSFFLAIPPPDNILDSKEPEPGLTPMTAFKKLDFYVLTLLLTIGQTISSFINPLYKSFGLQEIVSNDHFLTLIVIIGAVFNLLGRISWPLLSDLTSYRTTIILQGAFMSVFLLTFYSTVDGGKFMYFAWVCCILYGIGGYVGLFPSAVAKTFGPKYMSIVYGTMASIALTTGSILAGCISQVMVNDIEWYGTFFVFGALSCLYFVTILLYSCSSHRQPMF